MIMRKIIRKIFPFAGTNIRLVKNRIRKRYNLDKRKKFISSEFKNSIGYNLDWDNLKTYTEKMQWDKLYNVFPQKITYSDKIAVRDFVKEKIGEKYLIPILGVWDNFEDIKFETLPDRFVLKTNNGSQTNEFIKDKSQIDYGFLKKKFDKWLRFNYSYKHFEMQYESIKGKIFAEEFIDFNSDIEDYKFLCFDGEPKFCWVDIDRFNNHKRNIYDLDWNLQDWNQYTYGNYPFEIEKPDNFQEMVEVVTKLAEGFSHVRVDLYNVNGKILFGELTFTNGAGLEKIIPYEADLNLGKMWNLNYKNDKNSN